MSGCLNVNTLGQLNGQIFHLISAQNAYFSYNFSAQNADFSYNFSAQNADFFYNFLLKTPICPSYLLDQDSSLSLTKGWCQVIEGDSGDARGQVIEGCLLSHLGGGSTYQSWWPVNDSSPIALETTIKLSVWISLIVAVCQMEHVCLASPAHWENRGVWLTWGLQPFWLTTASKRWCIRNSWDAPWYPSPNIYSIIPE